MQPHKIYPMCQMSLPLQNSNSATMASLATGAPASHSIGALRRPGAETHAPPRAFITPNRHNILSHLNLRLKTEVGVHVRKNRFSPVFATNKNLPDGLDDAKTSDAAPGPPFLTILAGVLVFLFIFWVIGSFVAWVVGLIVHPPPLK